MAYSKTTWVNNTTPIDETNLNKLEQGVYDNSLKLETRVVNTANTSLDDYIDEGWYFFEPPYAPTNSPAGTNGFLEVRKASTFVKQFWYRAGTPGLNDSQTFVRTKSSNSGWGSWKKYNVPGDLYWTKTNYEVLSKYASYFVDGVNGNDNNDGKTQANAFKTLTPVWDAVKKGDMEIRFALAGGSTYIWEPYIINNLSIHIYCYGTGDVTIQMPDEPIAFYDCHLNWKGNSSQKLILTGAQKMYLDSGSATLQYMDIRFNYSNFGAGSKIDNCDMRDIECAYSNMVINASKVGGTIGSSSTISYEGCVFLSQYVPASSTTIFNTLTNCTTLIFGSTKVNLTGANTSGTFMRIRGGQLSQLAGMGALVASSNLWANGLDAIGCIVVATTARFNSYSNISTTATTLSEAAICTANL